MCNEPRTRISGGREGAQACGDGGRTSCARLREPADPAREGTPKEARGRAGPAGGLPRSASNSPSSPCGAGREHKRLQLPSGRRPTSPTPDPGRARGKEAAGERQGGPERAWMGRAGDPGRRARVGVGSGAGTRSYSGSRDSQNGRKNSF